MVQFFILEPTSALQLPPSIWIYSIILATFSTVLPLFLQAEALRRIGATEFGLIGALFLTYAGMALVVSRQVHGGAEGRLFAFGAALVFASALLYAIYLVAGGELIKRVGSMRFTAYSMMVATLPAVVQFFILEPTSALQLPASIWIYSIVLATFSTVLPLFLQAEALRRIGATEFGLIGALGPVSVAVTSAIGLDEPFTWVQAVGGALVIVGVLLVSLKRS